MMFGDDFEQATILRTGPDGVTRVITRISWAERESVLVEAYEAELVVLEAVGEVPRKGARVHAELGCSGGVTRGTRVALFWIELAPGV
jgi:hypothetical protein